MFKKICALVLAIAMVLVMSSVAMAAETDHDDTYKGSGSENAVISGTEIPLTKSIVLFNTDSSDIREPNISFTYKVTPVKTDNQGLLLPNNDVTVTDASSKTVHVYNGVASAFTKELVLTFSDTKKTEGGENVPNKQAAAQSGTELEKTGNLVVDPDEFPHAGIYRFVITETADPTDVTTVGLDKRTNDYKNTRYLDVYIKNNEAGTGLEMYGAVIFQSATGSSDDITTTTTKTTGFEPSNSNNYENDNTVDKYHTFNLEVNKTISGGLADKTHDFPFEITLTGNKTATITADYSNGSATYVGGTAPTTVNINNTTAAVLKPALSDGDSVTITGIPVGTKVLVKETNDTYDQYTPSISTQTGFTSLALNATAALEKDASTQLTAEAEITYKTAKSVIGLTNTLAEISPTGVVLRVAPYVLILGAGLALLLISRRRETASEEE